MKVHYIKQTSIIMIYCIHDKRTIEIYFALDVTFYYVCVVSSYNEERLKIQSWFYRIAYIVHR